MSIIADDRDQINDLDLNSRRDDEPVFDDDLLAEPRAEKVPHAPTAALKDTLDYFSGHDDISPQNAVVSYATKAYLRYIDPSDPPSPGDVEKHLLAIVNGVSRMENNKTKVATEKLPTVRTLTYWQVAQILLALHHVVRIAPNTKDTDREYDLLAMYVAEGPARGTHTTSEDDIRTAARQYNIQLSLKEFAEVLAVLREDSPRLRMTRHRDLVPVANGIFFYGQEDQSVEINGKVFDFTAKTLHPFDPSIIFTTKAGVEWDGDAESPVITHPTDGDWEIEEWMRDLFDDNEGLTELMWEILGAIVRPNVSWNKTAWLYSEQGNNGKGTLCSLMRELCGPRAHTSIPLSEFGKEFALEPLVRTTAIIVDENDVGTFIDKAANLKAVVTGDVIQINRKYRMPMAFEWRGFMVQCLNEFPRMKDKSESNYRRQLFVPFTKSFTGAEKRYIKDDYLKRPDVLQYVLKRVLLMDYYVLSEPPETKAVLAEYKEANDPVREFWAEFEERFVWDLLPWGFLYDLYKAWYPSTHPSGHGGVSKPQFIKDMRELIADSPEWSGKKGADKHRTGQLMSTPEPLIAEYRLESWMDPRYGPPGRDPMKISQPALKDSYYGMRRTTPSPATSSVAAP